MIVRTTILLASSLVLHAAAMGLGSPDSSTPKDTGETGDDAPRIRSHVQSDGSEPESLRSWAFNTADVYSEPVADLNLEVLSSGLSTIEVAPGSTVHYYIVGELSNSSHQGLALFGFDLQLDGGDLDFADTPSGSPYQSCSDNPMALFARPWGITNPDSPCPPACGFGGTNVDGDLIQVGGGQNTINNSTGPFPIGPVLVGVATPGRCGRTKLVTGSFRAPMTAGTYALSIPTESVFGNVISAGRYCSPDPDRPSTYCPVEPFGVGSITNLTFVVDSNPRPAVSWVPVGTGPHGELAPNARIDGRHMTIYADSTDGTVPVFLEIRLADWDPSNNGVRMTLMSVSPGRPVGSENPTILKWFETSCSFDEQCREELGAFCTISGLPCVEDSDCTLNVVDQCRGSACRSWDYFFPGCAATWISCGHPDFVDPNYGCVSLIYNANPGILEIVDLADVGIEVSRPFPDRGAYGGTYVVEVPLSQETTFTVDLRSNTRLKLVNNTSYPYHVDQLPATIRVRHCGGPDCQMNGIPDECDIRDGRSLDCNNNNIPDECDRANGTWQGHNPRRWGPGGIPEECRGHSRPKGRP